MLASSFGFSTAVLAALRAIDSMGKRPLDRRTEPMADYATVATILIVLVSFGSI